MTAVALLGTSFQNPVLLAAGTAGFGREVDGVIDVDALGGIVTKAVTPEPRRGHPAPRVAEFFGGMLNAVGLANPGLEHVERDDLPWLGRRLHRARVLVNVAGATVDDYVRVVERLTASAVVAAFEINASCPNTSAGGGASNSAPLRGRSRSWSGAAAGSPPSRSSSSCRRRSPTSPRWPGSRATRARMR